MLDWGDGGSVDVTIQRFFMEKYVKRTRDLEFLRDGHWAQRDCICMQGINLERPC